MKIKGVLFVLSFILLISFCECSSYQTDFENELEKKIMESEASLISFTVPWCKFSCRAMPKFEELKKRLKDKYFVQNINCEEYKFFCQNIQVGSFPSVNIFKRNVKRKYYGPLEIDSIINWFEKNVIFFGTALDSKEEIEKFEAENKKYFIGYFPNGITDGFRLYDSVANGYLAKKFKLGLIRDVKNIEGGSKEEKIIVNNSEKITVISQETFSTLDIQSLSEMIFDKSFELVSELTKESFQEYRSRKKDLFLSFIETSNPEIKKTYLDTLKELAVKYPQFSFGYIPFENNMDIVEQFEIPNKLPQSIVRYNFFDNIDDLFYSPPKPFSSSSISEWVDEINSAGYKPPANSPKKKKFHFDDL
eukprot:TRINITY_DN1321_c0_g1_i1.p1 TRINITY_DN1321_c0_g1~~TRINITY_DN1321_c0_g1_i1.p1  ORF type:complete len:362 (+),score=110.02 TRINITY_DN1321_c0_g1_i1:45-1130(+)